MSDGWLFVFGAAVAVGGSVLAAWVATHGNLEAARAMIQADDEKEQQRRADEAARRWEEPRLEAYADLLRHVSAIHDDVGDVVLGKSDDVSYEAWDEYRLAVERAALLASPPLRQRLHAMDEAVTYSWVWPVLEEGALASGEAPYERQERWANAVGDTVVRSRAFCFNAMREELGVEALTAAEISQAERAVRRYREARAGAPSQRSPDKGAANAAET